MSMVPEQQRLTPAERANLVAYLDEELDGPEAEALATKLTHSPTARRESELLQKTWQILDHLPMPRASEAWTEKTLTEARSLSERGERFDTVVAQATRRFARNLVWVAATLAACLGGFAASRWVWPSPGERLARDLPIAEHLDEYRDVGTFEFLNELTNTPEFGSGKLD